MTMTELDEFFMREALLEANKAVKSGDWPVGCVIVIDGEIVARGHNKVYSLTNKIFHAEIMAMKDAGETLANQGREATLYVTYEPCPMCIGAVLLNHFKRIVYGTDVDDSGGISLITHLPLRFQDKKYSVEIKGGVLEQQCMDVFYQGVPVKKKWQSKANYSNDSSLSKAWI